MNRFKFFKFIFCFGFVILNFGFIAEPVSAQSVGLSVSPPVVEILIAPNKQVSQSFTLHSFGEEDITITPQLHLFKPDGVSGHAQIDLSPLSPSSIPLVISATPPLNQSYDLNLASPDLTVTLKIDAVSSDIAQDTYLALVFQVAPSSGESSGPSAATTPSISSLIVTTLNPTGVVPINLEIKDFSPPTLHDTWSPLTISPLLENLTPIMIRPEGKYEIIAPSGKVIYETQLYPNLILGNSLRQIQSTINHEPSTMSWIPTWSALGPHKLILTITTQGGTKLTQIERVVWLLPIRIIILCTILFLLTSGIYLGKRKRFKLPIDTPLRTQ